MAEEIVWNKKLLVFSVLLGLLAAILFYVYDARMQKRLTGDTIHVLRWKRPLRNGEEIALADIDFPTIRKTFMKQLQGVLTRKDLNFVTGGVHVNRGVRRGDFVRFSDILESQTGSPSRNISEGMRAVTLRVDPSTTPGDMLWVNDRVDVVGLISVSGRPAKSYTIIENARVLAVGGRSQSPEEQFSVDRRGRRRQPGLRAACLAAAADPGKDMGRAAPPADGSGHGQRRGDQPRARASVQGRTARRRTGARIGAERIGMSRTWKSGSTTT